MSREIRDVVQVDGNSARAAVVVRIPDFRIAVGDVPGAVESAVRPAGAIDHMSFLHRSAGAFEQRRQAGGIPKKTIVETFLLARENGEWKVRAGRGNGRS